MEVVEFRPPIVIQLVSVAIPIIEFFSLRVLPLGTIGINPFDIAYLNVKSKQEIMNVL